MTSLCILHQDKRVFVFNKHVGFEVEDVLPLLLAYNFFSSKRNYFIF